MFNNIKNYILLYYFMYMPFYKKIIIFEKLKYLFFKQFFNT